MSQKVGLVVDDYKLDKLKEELEKEGFTNYKTMLLRKGVMAITIIVDDDKVDEIKKIMKKIDYHFNRSN